MDCAVRDVRFGVFNHRYFMFYKLTIAGVLILLVSFIAVGLIFIKGASDVGNGRDKSSTGSDREETG